MNGIDVVAEPGRVDQVGAPPDVRVDVDDGAGREVDHLLLDVGRRRRRRSHSTLVQFATPRNSFEKKNVQLGPKQKLTSDTEVENWEGGYVAEESEASKRSTKTWFKPGPLALLAIVLSIV